MGFSWWSCHLYLCDDIHFFASNYLWKEKNITILLHLVPVLGTQTKFHLQLKVEQKIHPHHYIKNCKAGGNIQYITRGVTLKHLSQISAYVYRKQCHYITWTCSYTVFTVFARKSHNRLTNKFIPILELLMLIILDDLLMHSPTPLSHCIDFELPDSALLSVEFSCYFTELWDVN